MKKSAEWCVRAGVWTLILACSMTSSLANSGEPRRVLPARLPAVVRSLHAIGSVPGTNQFHLAIDLPARQPAALAAFLRRLQDPASPDYHHYLTPAQFAEQFGPTAADYQAAIDFAETNGLRVSGRHTSRLVLEVTGTAADIEKTFQVKLRVYQHPKESRTFYAPDGDPSVAGSLPVTLLAIDGLDNYSRPQPASLHVAPAPPPGATPNAGSGPGSSYLGNDFRLAYVKGTPLNGNGQAVALLEFDGYYASDIAAYNKLASMTNVPLTNIAVNGGIGTPGTNNIEVALDIEMAISMAPGLAKVLVYEAPEGTPWTMILGQIADDNLALQISSSWSGGGINPNPAGEVIFQQMAAQGQSFFNASGDYDAYNSSLPFPEFPMDSPNVTVVGGTTLTTAARGGTRTAETAWNTGGGIGTGGGLSPNYALPTWQLGISSFASSGASTAARNIPDVALTADNVYVKYGDGQGSTVTGTSCATPLWAGFMALVNQKAAAAGLPPGGFINPAVYEIGNESTYNANFFDITTGNNVSSSSPNAYYAGTNYDLCTGLGTPKGTNLIASLASPDPLIVVSNAGFNAIATPAGTFNIAVQTFSLTNAGSATLAWSLVNTSAWLTASKGSGTLAPGAGDQTTVSLTTLASNLPPATYSATVTFSNVTSHVGHYRYFVLTTTDPLQVVPPAPLGFNVQPGVGATPATQSIILNNSSPSPLSWSLNNTSVWLAVTPLSGSLMPWAQTTLTVAPTWSAGNLADGYYGATLQITNVTIQHVQSVPVTLDIGLMENGGFETGDFSDWTLTGNTNIDGDIYNEVVKAGVLNNGSGAEFVHSGTYGAFLGDTNLATLAQTLPTLPGQQYVLSFWLANPEAGASQQFLVDWNTNGGSPNQIYYITSPPVLAWTNLSFTLTATGTNTTLVFGAENPPDGFGLDDISVHLLAAPGFASEPTNLTVEAGGTATFSATVIGTAPIACQWFQNGVSLTNGPGISGVATPTLTLAGVTLGSAGLYTLAVTNTLGSAISLGATLTVEQPPTIAGVTANPDGSITLNLAGTAGLTYVLESATNLAPPVTWLPINTNVPASNASWQFTDEQATNYAQQFYRLEMVP
jgi:hypothetical protein